MTTTFNSHSLKLILGGLVLLGDPSSAWAWGDEDLGSGAGDDPAPGTAMYTDGYVETHTHSLARYGYGGRYVHGEVDASAIDVETDLGPCTGTDHAVGVLPAWLSRMFIPDEFDRFRHPEGTHGFDADENVSFSDWPTWMTVSHSQVHPDHIKALFEAGETFLPPEGYLGNRRQNMKIFVMSAVNYRPLCTLLAESKGDIDPTTGSPYDCDDDTNLERQVELAWGMSHRLQDGTINPEGFEWFQVVTSYSEAVMAIDQGQLAVVLHLESSELMNSGLVDPELTFADIDRNLGRYYDLGVRSFQPVHELDNQFAGTARFRGYGVLRFVAAMADWKNEVGPEFWAKLALWKLAISNPDPKISVPALALPPWREYWREYRRHESGDGHNEIGLTLEGQYLVRAAMCAGMLVDVAHMSDKGFFHVNAASRNAYSANWGTATTKDAYPIFHSHGRFAAVQPEGTATEYNASDDKLRMVMDSGGMLGLRTDDNEVEDFNPNVPNNCAGSSKTWAQSYWHGTQDLNLRMGIASDMTSAVPQMRPRFVDEDSRWGVSHPFGGGVMSDDLAYPTWACGKGHDTHDVDRDIEQAAQHADGSPPVGTDFDIIGLGRYDLLDDIFIDLENLGQPVEVIKNESAQSFLEMWYLAELANREHRSASMDAFCSFDPIDVNGDGVFDSGEGTRGWPTTREQMEEYLEQEDAEAGENRGSLWVRAPDFMDHLDDWNWLIHRAEQQGQSYERPPYAPVESGLLSPCEEEGQCQGPVNPGPDFPPSWLQQRLEHWEEMLDEPLEPWQVDYLENLTWQDAE